MLFAATGHTRSLDAFLASIGSSTVSYMGQSEFYQVAAARIAAGFNASGRTMRFFTPHCHSVLAALCMGFGVEQSSYQVPGGISIVTDDDASSLEQHVHLMRAPLAKPLLPPKAKQASVCWRWMRDFAMPASVIETLAQRSGGDWREFSWETAAAGLCALLVTTDWQTHLAYTLLGGRSMLFAGPSYPMGAARLVGHNTHSMVVVMRDKQAGVARCPCIAPKSCHDKVSEAKPCWKSVTDQHVEVFDRLLHK